MYCIIGTIICDFIEDLDCDNGVVAYQAPSEGKVHSPSFRLTCELCSILCLWTYDHEGVTVFTPAYIVQEWNVTLSMHTHFRSRRENLCLYFQWQKR